MKAEEKPTSEDGTYGIALAFLIVVSLFIIKLNSSPMNVYVSRANTCDPALFDLVLQELEGLDITYHDIDGKYDPLKVPDCDVIIAIIDNGQETVGRGQYQELNTAALGSKKVLLANVDGDEILVHSLEDMTQLEKRDWKTYAYIRYDILGNWTIGEGGFLDYVQNGL